MEILGISCISNYAAGIIDKPLEHTEVIETGNKVKKIFKDVIRQIV